MPDGPSTTVTTNYLDAYGHLIGVKEAPETGSANPATCTITTHAKTAALTELCEHLTTTKTRYPGTNLTLKYAIKTKTAAPKH